MSQLAVQIGGDVRGRLGCRARFVIRAHVPDPAFTAAGGPRYDRDMRSRKYRVVTTVERASNRLIRAALRAGLAPRAFALLETTGRRTGLARHTPVGTG